MINKKRILVVEDDTLTAYWLVIELKKMGFFTYDPVTTGECAIEIALSNKPDYILMDVWLAGRINGIDAAKEILACYDVSIIFMSGYSIEDFISRIENVNYSGYLNKPLQIFDLEKVLRCGDEC